MKRLIVLLSIGLVLVTSGLAQEKGATALMNQKIAPATNSLMVKATPVEQPEVTPVTPPETNAVSAIVKEKSKVSYSVHSRGFIQNPKTREVNYEVVTLRERGLWGNGCVTQLLLNDEGKVLAVLNASASAGPGIAIVQGASFVGGMYLMAEHLRPDKVNSDNNNNNSGGSGNTGNGGATINNNNNATGGAGGAGGAGGLGGNATGGSVGNVSATGGAGGVANATGGTANNTVTGGLGSQNVNVNTGDARGRGTIIFGGGTTTP